jgi:hypothetical protein
MLAQADMLVRLPATSSELRAGTPVEMLRF